MGFLKVLKQPVPNIENIWKYALKWTGYLISIFIVSFDLCEISMRWFLLKSMLKQMWAQGWQSKRKQMGSILSRYQPSVMCNVRKALKSTFDFTEIVNELKWKPGTVCHCVRYFSQLSLEQHIQIFQSELICSLASNCHENNEVEDFLAQSFLLGCLSDFRNLPRI